MESCSLPFSVSLLVCMSAALLPLAGSANESASELCAESMTSSTGRFVAHYKIAEPVFLVLLIIVRSLLSWSSAAFPMISVPPAFIPGITGPLVAACCFPVTLCALKSCHPWENSLKYHERLDNNFPWSLTCNPLPLLFFLVSEAETLSVLFEIFSSSFKLLHVELIN